MCQLLFLSRLREQNSALASKGSQNRGLACANALLGMVPPSRDFLFDTDRARALALGEGMQSSSVFAY